MMEMERHFVLHPAGSAEGLSEGLLWVCLLEQATRPRPTHCSSTSTWLSPTTRSRRALRSACTWARWWRSSRRMSLVRRDTRSLHLYSTPTEQNLWTCENYPLSSLCLQAGGLSAQRTLRVGFLPPAWRPRMTLMTSPSPGMKVREVCGTFFINSKLLQKKKKTLALVFVAGSAAKYQVTDDSMDINIKILLKCHKYSFCAAAQVHKSPLDGAKYTHTQSACYLQKIQFMVDLFQRM